MNKYQGHINLLVRRALAEGYDFWNVLMAASINPQRHYHLDCVCQSSLN
jgi:adenine deaminase